MSHRRAQVDFEKKAPFFEEEEAKQLSLEEKCLREIKWCRNEDAQLFACFDAKLHHHLPSIQF